MRFICKRLLFCTCVGLVVVMAGCETLGAIGYGGGGAGSGFLGNINLLSSAQEAQLGQQFAVEVESQEKILNNATIQNYVADMGVRLARMAPRQDVPYSFKVIDAPETVNAFALPGGYMYVYTGLMKICESEAELAAVMAHEIAHVAAYHHGEMMTRQIGMGAITDLLLGNKPHAAASVVAQLFSTGISARYSRAQEREADRLGMDILYRAGYQPEGMITFMSKLLEYDKQRGGGFSLPIFATHPSPNERIQLLQELIQQYPLEMRQQRQVNREPYQQNILSQLP